MSKKKHQCYPALYKPNNMQHYEFAFYIALEIQLFQWLNWCLIVWVVLLKWRMVFEDDDMSKEPVYVSMCLIT